MDKTYLKTDPSGNLVIPKHIALKYGFLPGAETLVELNENALVLHQAVSHLRRVDIEVTNQCNLSCNMCIRRFWQAAPGQMTSSTFKKIIDDLRDFSPAPVIFLGGYGEPLHHPQIVEFIKTAKAIPTRVELITNGSLLTPEMAAALIDAGLDFLWVSLDGATAPAYGETRTAAEFPSVLNNLHQFNFIRHQKNIDHLAISGCCVSEFCGKPELGLAFVAGRKNIAELPGIIELARRISAKKISVSNLLAYSEDLRDNILYRESHDTWQNGSPVLSLPPMDVSEEFVATYIRLADRVGTNHLSGEHNGNQDVCPFVARGSLSIRWDGQVSPCWPLLYTHEYYLGQRLRRSTEFFVGSVVERSVKEIWQDAAYTNLRMKIGEFQFAPCTQCNNCELADHNQEDCIGNPHPDCGGCLWAQGFIVCP